MSIRSGIARRIQLVRNGRSKRHHAQLVGRWYMRNQSRDIGVPIRNRSKNEFKIVHMFKGCRASGWGSNGRKQSGNVGAGRQEAQGKRKEAAMFCEGTSHIASFTCVWQRDLLYAFLCAIKHGADTKTIVTRTYSALHHVSRISFL